MTLPRGPRGRALLSGGLFLLLAFAASRLDVARHWRLEFGRGEAIARARGEAAELGLDVSRWRTAARVVTRPEVERLLIEQPGAAGALSLPAAFHEVRFVERDGAGELTLRLDGAGRVRALELEPWPRGGVAGQENEAAARQVLGRWWGPEAASFELATGQRMIGGIEHLLFRRPDPGRPGVEETVELGLREGKPYELEWAVEVKPEAADDGGEGHVRWLVLLALVAALVYGVQCRRYLHAHRGVKLVAMAAAGLALLVVLLRLGQLAFEQGGRLVALLVALLDPIATTALLAAVFYAGGVAAGRMRSPKQVAAFEALLQGRRGAAIWRSVARGVVAGIGLALLATLLPLVLPGGPFASRIAEVVPAGTGLPWLQTLVPRLEPWWFALFAFVAPLLRQLLRAGWLARVGTVGLGALVLAPVAPIAAGGPELAVLMAAALAFAGEQVYQRAGLLAVLLAGWAAGVAGNGAALLVQPGMLALHGVLVGALLAGLAFMAEHLAERRDEETLTAGELAFERRLQAERERIKAQLEIAREAQLRMLPSAPPGLPGWQIAVACRPAREVGGDFYDFVPAGERWGITLGDVSGKGMVASLYMTFTKGLVLAAAEHCTSPAEILSEVNHGLHANTERSTFVTLWYGLLDPATGELCSVRAGHNPPLWRRAATGDTVEVRPPGLPLGAVKSALFARGLGEETIRLAPGDTLFVYSDGLSEAMDEEKEEYGTERLLAAVAAADGLSAEAARDHVLADVDVFTGNAPQHDDMTLLVLRCDARSISC